MSSKCSLDQLHPQENASSESITKTGMRDFDIRRVLCARLREKHQDHLETLIIEELGLCQGRARVDVAVVNGSLHGYEIKSECDTLQRLKRQREIYNSSLDAVTIVAARRHVESISHLVPVWWGIVAVACNDGTVTLTDVRDAGKNPDVDASAIVQLLWREEAMTLLAELGLSEGLSGKPRRVLWARLVEKVSHGDLAARIRQTLRDRSAWRLPG